MYPNSIYFGPNGLKKREYFKAKVCTILGTWRPLGLDLLDKGLQSESTSNSPSLQQTTAAGQEVALHSEHRGSTCFPSQNLIGSVLNPKREGSCSSEAGSEVIQ